MTWLIVGASGQLGTTLVSKLRDNSIPYFSPTRKEFDLTNPTSFLNFRHPKPSVIVNCGAWTDVERAEQNQSDAFLVNERGTFNIATFAKSLGTRLVHISTDYVFSGIGNQPWKKMDTQHPQTVYGKSKSAGETSIRMTYSQGTLLMRTAWLYSPLGRNFAKTMTRLALKNQACSVVDDQYGQPTMASDLADRIISAVHFEIPAGEYHVTNSGTATWNEFAREIYSLAKADPNLVTKISSEEYPSKVRRPKYSVLDDSMWQEVGMSPLRDWREALHEVFPKIRIAVENE